MNPAQTSWFEEMKRRRVFRALIGYGIVSFAVLQIIEPVMHGLNLPEWVLTATVVGLGLGFPFTLVLAWIFDVKGGRIETTVRQDPSIIGGLIIRIGDRVIDGSLRTRLQQLRAALA